MKKLLLILTFCLISNIAQANCQEGNCKDGFGTLVWGETGTKYVGNFKNSLMHGKGKLNYSDGGYYEGEFKKGLKDIPAGGFGGGMTADEQRAQLDAEFDAAGGIHKVVQAAAEDGIRKTFIDKVNPLREKNIENL